MLQESASFIEKVGASRKLGFVSRVLVNDLELALYRDDALEFTLGAERATAGSSEGDIDFEGNFRMTSSGGQRLAAHRARWSNEHNRLRIDGDYRILEGPAEMKGSGSVFLLGPEARILLMEKATGRQ